MAFLSFEHELEPVDEILTLGSLSKAPFFFVKEQEEDGQTGFIADDTFPDQTGFVTDGTSPGQKGFIAVDAFPGQTGFIAPDAIGIATVSNVVSTAGSWLERMLPSGVISQEMPVRMQPATPYPFPGLADARPDDSSHTAQVVGRASDIVEDFPPIWYVRLPNDMSDERREELSEKSQAIHDFKCWSGLKWWADVFKAVPTTGDFDNKMRQSSAFAFFAGRDMQQFEWLRRHEPPVRQETTFECMQSDLHANIMEFAIGSFQGLDEIGRRALEPLFKQILSSASDSTIDFQDQRVVMAEKHELIDNNIVSCIRMINFQVGESFYSVPQGKDGVRRLVRCHVEFSQIDAEFDMAKWETFSQNIAPDQKKAVEDFIFKQTLDMDPPAVSAATGFVNAAMDCSDSD